LTVSNDVEPIFYMIIDWNGNDRFNLFVRKREHVAHPLLNILKRWCPLLA